MLTKDQIREAQDWLHEQRAVVHPGPIETIREALQIAMAQAIYRQQENQDEQNRTSAAQ